MLIYIYKNYKYNYVLLIAHHLCQYKLIFRSILQIIKKEKKTNPYMPCPFTLDHKQMYCSVNLFPHLVNESYSFDAGVVAFSPTTKSFVDFTRVTVNYPFRNRDLWYWGICACRWHAVTHPRASCSPPLLHFLLMWALIGWQVPLICALIGWSSMTSVAHSCFSTRGRM